MPEERYTTKILLEVESPGTDCRRLQPRQRPFFCFLQGCGLDQSHQKYDDVVDRACGRTVGPTRGVTLTTGARGTYTTVPATA